MAVTLSSEDLESLTHAIQLLVSPLDYSTVDQWRSAVNHQLRELLHADSAGFLLPVSEGLMLHSEEHDPKELASYPDVVAPGMADGTPMWEQMIMSRVDTLANLYGGDYHRYLGSEYYNDYAGANGAHDTLFATMSVGGRDAKGMAGLHFWHANPDARLFGDREIALLRLLFPALQAGVEAQLRWGGQRQELLSTLDQMGQAALVCDFSGTLVHVTPGLEAVLQADAEAEHLRVELFTLMREVCRSAAGHGGRDGSVPGALVRETRTRSARYLLRGCLYGRQLGGGAAYTLVGLERLTPARRSPEDLREAFSLTRAELRVALLLGDGNSNADIAQKLFISPYTARRHTERVLFKMGVRSRSEVASRLYT